MNTLYNTKLAVKVFRALFSFPVYVTLSLATSGAVSSISSALSVYRRYSLNSYCRRMLQTAGQLQSTRCQTHVSQTCIDNNLLSDICTFHYHITGTRIRTTLRSTSILCVQNSVAITVRHSQKKIHILCKVSCTRKLVSNISLGKSPVHGKKLPFGKSYTP